MIGLRNISLIAIIVLLRPANSLLADQFEDVKKQATQALLKPLAKDLGAVIGGGTFHTGRSLGFPGVDVGLHAALQSEPDSENLILKNAKVKSFGAPMLQGEIGLPYNLDVILRGISFEKITIVGGGLRYGLFKLRGLPLTPAIAISGFAHSLNHTDFSLAHLSGNIAVDLSVPIVQPYVGFGIDSTRIKLNASTNPALIGIEDTAKGTRATIGVNIKPLPLIYLHGAYTLMNSNGGYEMGLGVKF